MRSADRTVRIRCSDSGDWVASQIGGIRSTKFQDQRLQSAKWNVWRPRKKPSKRQGPQNVSALDGDSEHDFLIRSSRSQDLMQGESRGGDGKSELDRFARSG